MLGGFPNWYCPERWSGMNWISHPDWVKLCVDTNGRIKLRAKQKYEILSDTCLIHFCFNVVGTNAVFKLLLEEIQSLFPDSPFLAMFKSSRVRF